MIRRNFLKLAVAAAFVPSIPGLPLPQLPVIPAQIAVAARPLTIAELIAKRRAEFMVALCAQMEDAFWGPSPPYTAFDTSYWTTPSHAL